MNGDLSKVIFLDREASLRNISGKETNEMECWIRPRGQCEEREGGQPRSTLFVVAVSIDADYEDVDHPECMSIGYVFMFAILMWPFFIAGCRASQASLPKSLRTAWWLFP